MGLRRFAGSFPVDMQACDAEQKPAETTSPAGDHRRVLGAGVYFFVFLISPLNFTISLIPNVSKTTVIIGSP